MKPLVIGIGNRWRCDDGVGPRAVEALRERLGDDLVDLVTLDGEPGRIVSAWSERPWVLVIDAIRTGAAPGTISFVEAGSLPDTSPRGRSSHDAGLDAAIALGRALDRLPHDLVVAGIEPVDLGHGDELSEPVARTFATLIDRVEAEVRATCA